MKILIVLPVYNEEKIIGENLRRLALFCQENLIDEWQIVVADNRSVDKTKEIVQALAKENPRLIYYYLSENGKGQAVLSAWRDFSADIYCFMDADLSTDLKSLPALIQAVKDGADLAIGSRRQPLSRVNRSLLKKIISWGYNLAVRLILKSKLKDHPCGFKAVNGRVVKELVPLIENNQWFFDTELLILAERSGYSIKELPVEWVEPAGRKSKVKIISLIVSYLKQLWQLRKRLGL